MATKWTVEIVVNDTWVDDGFSLDGDAAELLTESILPYAYGYEKQARTLKRETVPELSDD